MSKLSAHEQREVERLSQKEKDEPAFVTQKKQAMIRLIKAGKFNDIEFDEWGEVYYPIDPENHD